MDSSSPYSPFLATLPTPESLPGSTPPSSSCASSSATPPALSNSSVINSDNPSSTDDSCLQQPVLTGLYSTTGFDILTFLEKVVRRPNPTIQLGQVDFSCCFLISDASLPDCPLVYVSDAFETMTGYKATEVLGKNCRFLQAPDGQVKPGSVRNFSDNNVISHMKACIDARKECQFSLVNYKKSGEPFINLITVIPICYYEEGRVSHFIGLQVDLVKQPECIMQRMRDGTYHVNYQLKPSPAPVSPPIFYNDEAVDKEVVTELLSPYSVGSANTKDSSSYHTPVVHSTFIDNCGDFVHILSIRGLFLYASPKACEELLGYSAFEVLGRNISEFMHPTDDTFVTRILRHALPAESINMICRLKRKDGTYVYVEFRGHVYQGGTGKRTRCIVMSGRQKKVGSLLVQDILAPDNGRPECWAKVSLEGLFLYNCPSTPDVFDGLTPDDLYAHSLFEYVALKDQDRLRHAMEYVAHSARFYDVQRLSMSMNPDKPDFQVHIRLYNDGASASATNLLYCQIKLLTDSATGSTYPVDMRTMKEFSGLYQGGNIFDFMTNDKAPPIHFEINNLKIQNKKLKEELEAASHPPKRPEMTIDNEERANSEARFISSLYD